VKAYKKDDEGADKAEKYLQDNKNDDYALGAVFAELLHLSTLNLKRFNTVVSLINTC
jgi:hypothetical protein